ncbi:hypothetical protein ZWY2020_010994 [Hordeum vulgare]|nr:hypothetical protein ZWY2020_010994 [Hordeum vulgare]
MLFLMAASKGLLLYRGLLRAFPNSTLLHRLLDRSLVAVVFVVLVVADLAAADAIPNIIIAHRRRPILVLHAAFRVCDNLDLATSTDNAGGAEDKERTRMMVEKKEDGDVETGPTRLSATAAAAKC